MSVIVRPLRAEELPAFARLQINAYPGFHSANETYRREFKERLERLQGRPGKTYFAAFRGGEMVGGMLLHDFTMRLFDADAPLGGVGMVATDLTAKKEKVAKTMIEYFLRHYQEKGYPLAALYPFRPDFYKRMGFGYGAKIHQYRLTPGGLPGGLPKAGLRRLGWSDMDGILDCYNRYAAKTHGMIRRDLSAAEAALQDPEIRMIGVEGPGGLAGYMAFRFQKDNAKGSLDYDLEVVEWLYETPDAMLQLLNFLHTQSDQVRSIAVHTHDDSFHYLLGDPRNGTGNLLPCIAHETNVQGLGLMYRIVNVAEYFRLLADRSFGGETLRLKISTRDSFCPETDGDTFLAFEDGKPRVVAKGNFDAAIGLEVADLSALLVGAVSFRKLYEYRLADLSDSGYLDRIDRLFRSAKRPICLQRF